LKWLKIEVTIMRSFRRKKPRVSGQIVETNQGDFVVAVPYTTSANAYSIVESHIPGIVVHDVRPMQVSEIDFFEGIIEASRDTGLPYQLPPRTWGQMDILPKES